MSERVFSPGGADFNAAISAQAQASDPDVSAWVTANAGSGKTKVLIDRVARLLLRGAEPDAILCVTYTKAAANEMVDRLFKRLGAWSVMEAGRLKAELSRLEGIPESRFDPGRLDAARALFAKALETPGGLRIETIHAFCGRVLRRFPLEAGIAPGFREIDEPETAALWDEARKTAILQAPQDVLDQVALAGGVEAGLNALRSNAAAAMAWAGRFTGDPGALRTALSGALRAPEADADTLIRRIMGEDLPRAGLKDALGSISASEKSTDRKLANAVQAALSDAPADVRWPAYLAAFTTTSGWRKQNPYTAAVGKAAPVASLFQMAEIPEGGEVTRLRRAVSEVRAARARDRTLALLTLGLPAIQRFQTLKQVRGALDFDDLIDRTRALLTNADAAQWVLYKLDGGLTHVLLDEAQDTSPDQWALLNALTGEFFSGAGVERAPAPRTQFVVGDEKQSIYSFQGADPDHFRDERQSFVTNTHISNTEGVTPEMSMSFRSSPEVLNFVDDVFDPAAFEGAPFGSQPPEQADVPRHTARRANQPGCVELWPIEPPGKAAEADPWHAPVDQIGQSNPKARLARDVAAEISRILQVGETVWVEQADRSWSRRAAEPGDILILVQNRTGGLFDLLINALKERGLPVAGADRLKLLDHIGVQDCLNLIRFALLPEDDLTLAEILRGPFCGLVDDDVHLFPLAFDRGGVSLWSRLCASPDPRHAGPRAFLTELLDRAGHSPFDFLSAILERPITGGQTGWERLRARLGDPVRDPIQALASKALAFDASSPASLQAFLSAIEAEGAEIKRDLAAPDGEIRVMTVHGAKGLQAPIVILPDTTRAPKTTPGSMYVVDGAPVWAPRKDDDPEPVALAREMAKDAMLREHRRLLYVALTRAQDRLILCGAWHGAPPEPEGSGRGRHDASWYALCARVFDADAADGVQRRGDRPPSAAAQSRRDLPSFTPGWLHRNAPAERPNRRLAAPSALMQDEAPVSPPFGPDREARLKRGRLIHALLQRLPDIAPGERAEQGRRFLERDASLSDKARSEMLAAALGVLDNPDFAEVFAPGGRAEAAIIGTAPELPDGLIVNGRVDRLRLAADSVLIVDFKTDRPAPTDASGVGRSYATQMAAYRAVLKQAYPDREVRCALVWTDGPKLMALPDTLLDQIF